MGVPHQKIYFGNWMLYSLLSETFTGNFFSKFLFLPIILKEIFFKNFHTNSRPDPEFAEHLNQRLKMMACDMIDSCIKRTDASFQNHLKKGILLNPTDYIVPTEICAMINVVLDAKNQSFKLCAVDGVDVVSFNFTKYQNSKSQNDSISFINKLFTGSNDKYQVSFFNFQFMNFSTNNNDEYCCLFHQVKLFEHL